MIKDILLLSTLITIACLAFFFLHYKTNIEVARTGTFMLLILLELVVIQMIRMDYGVKFWSNKRLFISIAVSILLTMTLMYVPALANIFQLAPLSLAVRGEMTAIIIGVVLVSFSIHHFKQEKAE